jgi:cobalt-zinc-cadmium efflux system outer membrane protein
MLRFLSLATRRLCIALLACSVPAHAGGPPLTLAQALERAAVRHPALGARDAALRAHAGRAAEAALAPQSSVDLLIEDAAGSGEREGFASAQTTLSLSHQLEPRGKRDGRIAVAGAEGELLRTERDVQRLDIAAEVTRRFVDTLLAQAQMEVAADALEGARRTHDAVDRRVGNALAPAAEVARAAVGLEQAKLGLEHAQHELAAARWHLAAAMGDREVEFGPSIGALLELGDPLPFDEIVARMESSPDFVRFGDAARVRDAEIRLAELRARPDVRTQFGVRQYGDGNDVALVAGVSVPIGTGRRASSGIEIARAERSRVDAEKEVALLAARAQLFDQYQELGHARRETRVLGDTIVPRLTDALQKSEHAYERGRYSYLEWSQVQDELVAARRRHNEAAARFHTLLIEIERMSGEPAAFSGGER